MLNIKECDVCEHLGVVEGLFWKLGENVDGFLSHGLILICNKHLKELKKMTHSQNILKNHRFLGT